MGSIYIQMKIIKTAAEECKKKIYMNNNNKKKTLLIDNGFRNISILL